MTIQEQRAKSVLDTKLNYSHHGIMTRREFMNLKHSQGWNVREVNARNHQAEEKLRNYLESRRFDIPFGNPNYPATKSYLEDEARLKAGIFKTTYEITNGKSIYDITKTEYDYFQNLSPVIVEEVKTPETTEEPTEGAKYIDRYEQFWGVTVEEVTETNVNFESSRYSDLCTLPKQDFINRMQKL